MSPFEYTIKPSAQQTKTDSYANSVDSYKTDRNEPSHQDLHYLPFCLKFTMKPLFEAVDMSKFKDGGVHFRNSGMKGLIIHIHTWMHSRDKKEI